MSKIDNKINGSPLQLNYQLTFEKNIYIIDKVIAFDDETTTYECESAKQKKSYYIKEFFPRSLCIRKEDGNITPIQGKEVQYKNLLEDMLYIWENILSADPHLCIKRPAYIFKNNNTIYAVWEKIYLKNIENILIENGHPYQWSEIKKKYINLCQTINYFHKKSIIHRGLCSKTIMVDENGDFIVTSFSTAANRTEKSEIRATLYEGFSAPEQYSPKLWQGEWTDIYSLACILYKLLTACNIKKDENNKIIDAISINPEIPEYVSDAISSCLNEKTNLRTQCIDDFTAMLLTDTSSNTIVFPMTKIYESENICTTKADDTINQGTTVINLDTKEPSIQKENNKSKKTTIFLCIILALSLIILFKSIMYQHKNIISKESLEPEEIYEFVPFTSYTIDNFVGEDLNSVIENENLNKKYNFYIKEDYSDTYIKGQIISQYPRCRTKSVNKSNIILTVSKGTRTIVMPNIIGKDIDYAVNLMRKYGVKYQVIEMYNDNLPSNTVRSCNFDAGSTVDIYNDTVFIYSITSLNKNKEE